MEEATAVESGVAQEQGDPSVIGSPFPTPLLRRLAQIPEGCSPIELRHQVPLKP